MRRKIISGLAVSSIIGGLLSVTTPAMGARQAAIVADGSNPKISQTYPALTASSTMGTHPGVRKDIPPVGNTDAGEVAVTENLAAEYAGDPGRSFPRCSDTKVSSVKVSFPWCDTMELIVQNVPRNSQGKPSFGLELLLTWPGEGRIDPDSKREIKDNNLDFFFYIETFEAWVFEDAGTPSRAARATVNDEDPDENTTIRFTTPPTIAKRSNTKRFHPEQIILGDLPPSGEKVPLELYAEAPLGGPDNFENTYDANGNGYTDVPKCPAQVYNSPQQRDLCPRIIEHYNTFKYYLLVINVGYPDTPPEHRINKGYTISSFLEPLVFPSGDSGGGSNFGGFTRSGDSDNVFDFDDFTPPKEGLKPVKEPGADGPDAMFNLLALKGQSRGPEKQKDSGMVTGVGILFLLALLIFAFLFYIKRRRRDPAEI